MCAEPRISNYDLRIRCGLRIAGRHLHCVRDTQARRGGLGYQRPQGGDLHCQQSYAAGWRGLRGVRDGGPFLQSCRRA